MDTVNVVAVTSDARPISGQFGSWQEAADAVVKWSKDPFYLHGGAVLVTVVMADKKTLVKHDLDSGKFGRDWQLVYAIDTPAETIGEGVERLAEPGTADKKFDGFRAFKEAVKKNPPRSIPWRKEK